jgi:hypothetical protein
MNDIEWLEQWYEAQCNGEWEHQHGVKIDSLDNPGWWVRISLAGTDLEHRRQDASIATSGEPPEIIRQPEGHAVVADGSADWLLCRIKDGAFDGAGDPNKLATIIGWFRRWATHPDDKS